jgi:hypothetical protein
LSLDPEATTLSKGETASAQTAPCQQPLTQRLNDTRQTQKKKHGKMMMMMMMMAVSPLSFTIRYRRQTNRFFFPLNWIRVIHDFFSLFLSLYKG